MHKRVYQNHNYNLRIITAFLFLGDFFIFYFFISISNSSKKYFAWEYILYGNICLGIAPNLSQKNGEVVDPIP